MSIKSIEFLVPTTDEIVHSLTVVDITNPMTTVEFAKNNTLFDTRMGAFRNVKCDHCNGNFKNCSGHHGRIKLVYPCINSKFLSTTIRKMVDNFCYECFKRKCNCICEREVVSEKTGKKKTKIVHTEIKMYHITKKNPLARTNQGLKYMFRWGHKDDVITIIELYDLIKKIPKEEFVPVFGEKFARYTDMTEVAFLKYVIVLPTTSRPPNMMGGEWKSDGITRLYNNVLKKNIDLTMKKDIIDNKLRTEYHNQLQCSIDILFDVKFTNNKLRQNVTQGGGLRQRIDGKEGRLRMNLMGKRTEFSARTVLSGDPRLGINEVGIPRKFADDLTIPVTITSYNLHKINGMKIKYAIKKDGRKYDTRVFKNCKLEIGDTVERCLVDGDIVIVNRQPTLHRGSMIACYVRIFDCLTLRLNYSTMVTLNADTDGDCLNIHVPQDLESRTELEELMLASNNIVCSQSSKPLVGCTQDSLLGCYKLSKQAKVHINDYMEMLNEANLYDDIFEKRSTVQYVRGTRFITAVLNHLDIFIDRYEPSEDFLLVNNVIEYGVLDKAIVGAADDSLIHNIFLMAGHKKAAEFIHLIQTVATSFLDIHGFSIGVSDCIVDHEKLNFKALEDKIQQDFFKRGGRWNEKDEAELSDALSELTKLKAPENIGENSLLDMIQSGAKGSIANFNQITRTVGQQVTDEGRVPKQFKNRTLPHYTQFDVSAESRGLIKNSFIKGLTPQEFFFHSMCGRIGIIDTSIKTSVTGAQFRRLVKVTEPLVVKDYGGGKRPVVNNTTDQVVQFEYGDDNLDGTYTKRLKLDNNKYIKLQKDRAGSGT